MESTSTAPSVVKKSEDDDKPIDRPEVKPPVRTLNRVPRACNACRRQKMRCEGAENPPCRRCRNSKQECLFEKPSREASLTGEAGLERIRALEGHVSDILKAQTNMSSNIAEILNYIRSGSLPARSPSTYPPFSHQPSPNLSSPSISTPTASHPQINDTHHHPSSPGGPPYPPSHGPPRPRSSLPNVYPPSQASPADLPTPQYAQPYNNYNPHGQPYPPNQQGAPTLPPFSSIQSGVQSLGRATSQPQVNVSSVRFQPPDSHRSASRHGHKRGALAVSAIASADSSDFEDEDNGDLPASGLVAPWEVLRVVSERIEKEGGDTSEPHSRTRTPSPDRPSKRRKTHHLNTPTFQDVVTKGIISESQAREFFKIFYNGCSTFLPVFDANVDTYDSLRERSPFAVNAICMVAARVRDGGKQPSEIHKKLLEEVQHIARASLFAPVLRAEAVQAMILVSGWSDNNWLPGGHAVRMAMELSMHTAWPRILRRMAANKGKVEEDRELIVASRIWFCLYLFEHQLSYGTGRPAVLKDDESVHNCHLLLDHPLSIEDDMRLVSTVELIKIRERVHNALYPLEGPVRQEHFATLRQADDDFEQWYRLWDATFSKKWPDAAFYRQSLQIQQLHAQLFHNATSLRGINGPNDVQRMPSVQRDLAIRSIQIAQKGLDITVNSPSYRAGMAYAVHYTHATATFAASFLLRLARLFPDDCDINSIRGQVEQLARLMSEIPGRRYALTLQLMLKRFTKRQSASSPKVTREQHTPMTVDQSGSVSTTMPISNHRNSEQFSPTYDAPPFANNNPHGHLAVSAGLGQHGSYPHHHHLQTDAADQIWQGFDHTPHENLPVWISDQTLGGNSFSQHGIDAFLLPNEYIPAPQIW